MKIQSFCFPIREQESPAASRGAQGLIHRIRAAIGSIFTNISEKFWSFRKGDVITPPWWIAKIFKIPVFRLSLGTDLISRVIIAIHNFFSRKCQGGDRAFRTFDPKIAQKSLDRFIELGAQVHFVTPRDQLGQVQMMTFRAQDLEQKIREHGGSWERRVVQGKQVFAIAAPESPSQEWVDFKEKLAHFHWKEEEGMLITCDAADLISENEAPRCFLYAHSTSGAFTSDWKRAGLYLGMKQDFCFFDNGNTWKNQGRSPSEEGFYLEIEAVYEKIKDEYPPERLWTGGSCGGAPVAAYLKRRLHDQGINFFVEQSFPDLNDFVKPIVPFFAPYVKGSLQSGDLPAEMEDRPPACQFGAAKLWEPLQKYEGSKGGKFIFVQVEDDEHISTSAYERYLALAQRVNNKVDRIFYTSNSNWRHADDFYRYEGPRRQFVQSVFSKPRSV
jgi:hypothetical protein